ncbi:MAG: prepilin-type N-terminal cleavage/methylation domain-containing protein [Rhizobacter sp.]|nr:prepilin-type N-terminal cleavage/methylation domain-containing protein [Burkholderiales bacterium]
MSRLQHPQQGFTLLEVIVAVVIAALCLAALSQVFATGVRAASTSSDYMRAMTLAQSLLAGVGVEKTAADGSESGTSIDGRLQWTVTISPEPTDEGENLVRPPLELKRVRARVVAASANDAPGNRGRTVELVTLLAVPRQTP